MLATTGDGCGCACSVALVDFRFLEEAKRTAESAKRSKPSAAPKVPFYFVRLQKEAAKRGVTVKLLAPGMERRRTNSSCLSKYALCRAA